MVRIGRILKAGNFESGLFILMFVSIADFYIKGVFDFESI